MNALKRPLNLVGPVNYLQVRNSHSFLKDFMDKFYKANRESNFFGSRAATTDLHPANQENEFIYAGSMAFPKLRQFPENVTSLKKLIDFDGAKIQRCAKNKLSIQVIQCPKLLHERVKEIFQFYRLPEVSVILVSFAHYSDKIKGRKDCLIAANELAVRLDEKGFWSYFSASLQTDKADVRDICYFKNFDNIECNELLAPILHVNISVIGNCIQIGGIGQPLKNSVGVIYTDAPADIKKIQKCIRSKAETLEYNLNKSKQLSF